VSGPGSSIPSALVRAGSRFYFKASTPETGAELWSTDGVNAPALVRDIAPGASSGLRSSTFAALAVGDRLLFTGCGRTGCEPWVTDGTEAGTYRVADVQPGLPDSDADRFTRSGALVYFAAAGDARGSELWALPASSLEGPPPESLADLDGDGDADDADRELFFQAFGRSIGDPAYAAEADIDSDGVVTLADYQTWLAEFASFEPPPPSSTSLASAAPETTAAVPVLSLLGATLLLGALLVAGARGSRA
jgi:ELWxxDGT repeat protein